MNLDQECYGMIRALITLKLTTGISETERAKIIVTWLDKMADHIEREFLGYGE